MNVCPLGGTHAWAETGRADEGRWWRVRVACGCGRWYDQREWKDGSE